MNALEMPDIVGSYARGRAVYQARQQEEQQNALRAFLQENGGALMSGDQNALAAYAQYDPQAAFGMQRQNQQMGMEQERLALDKRSTDQSIAASRAGMANDASRMQMAREEGRRQAAEFALKLDDRQKADLAAKAKSASETALVAYKQGPEAWDRWNDSNPGFEDVSYEDAPIKISTALGALDALMPKEPAEMTPYQKAQIDIQNRQLETGNRGTYGLNPIRAADANGNPVLLQPKSSGGADPIELPEGVTPTFGVEKIDAGDHWILMDRQSGNVVGQQPKNVRNEASEAAIGKAQGEMIGGAMTSLSGAEAKAQQASDLIDSILTDPALPSITGMLQGRLPPMTQGATDLNVKIDQVRGKAFLDAFESLKGGGAITEREGQAATEAMARLDRAQSTEEYAKALTELRDIMNAGVGRMRVKAGRSGSIPPSAAAAGIDPDLWRYMSPEDQALWQN